jgi:hypothetical protein
MMKEIHFYYWEAVIQQKTSTVKQINKKELKNCKITNILNVSEHKNYFENIIEYKTVLIFDDDDEKIEEEFDKCHEYISK